MDDDDLDDLFRPPVSAPRIPASPPAGTYAAAKASVSGGITPAPPMPRRVKEFFDTAPGKSFEAQAKVVRDLPPQIHCILIPSFLHASNQAVRNFHGPKLERGELTTMYVSWVLNTGLVL